MRAGFSLQDAAGRMQGLAGRIRGVLQGREEDFLALGARFMDFSGASRILSKKAADLAELTAGGAIEQGIEQLSGEMEEMSGACDFSTGEESLAELKGLLGVIDQLMDHVRSFGRIVRSLQMLGISTRIESARLGSSGLGFATLADDVEKLALMIVAKSGAIMEKGKSLHGMIVSVEKRTGELTWTQKGCSERIMTEVGANLDALLSMAARSREVIAELSGKTADIARNISEVVSSMQFHDIVRQQVEHVDEALMDMADLVRTRPARALLAEDPGAGPAEHCSDALAEDATAVSGPAPGNPGPGASVEVQEAVAGVDERDLVGLMADVSAIQVSQLKYASDRLREAVAGLSGSLLGIADGVLRMGRDVAGIMDMDSAKDGTVLDRIEAGSVSIIGTMREFTLKAAEIGGLMRSVAGTVAEIGAFVDDIEDVGSEIELIAINASIKAAHTGEGGKALGVLAGAIQHLSVDARAHTQVVSDFLRRIAEAAATLEGNASRYTETTQLRTMAGRQEALMTRLRQVNATFQSLFAEVGGESQALGASLDDLARGITLADDVCPDLDQARLDLEELVRLARLAVPESEDERRPERLRDLLARYTMEAERLVHADAFGQDQQDEAQGAAGEAGDRDLFGDDNVELF